MLEFDTKWHIVAMYIARGYKFTETINTFIVLFGDYISRNWERYGQTVDYS